MSTSSSQRRRFLKAACTSISLPWLASAPRAIGQDTPREKSSTDDTAPPRRMVCVGNEFGMHPDSFWPTAAGKDYQPSPLLRPVDEHRDHFTLFGNLDHAQKGGHFAVHTFLTGIKHDEARGVPEMGVSLDQVAAEHVGSQTRFPSLTIGSEGGLHGGCQMSWTRTGTRVPPIGGPAALFKQLFVDTDGAAKRQAFDRLDLQGSILDAVNGDAQALHRRLNRSDQHKLDEYLTSIREVEAKLQLDRHWQRVPKPEPPIEMPKDEGLTQDLPKLYDLIALALQTDSTRVATLEIGGSFSARDLGINQGYHGLSHHGQKAESIDLLVQIERYQMTQLARFLNKLRTLRDPSDDRPLLDHTMVLFGSGMGNANSHTNVDLPILLAGGGFRHVGYRQMPAADASRMPLSNLYLSMLQRFGVPTEQFAHSTSTLRGLETA